MVGGVRPIPGNNSTPEQLVQKIFSEMDKNCDGRLSRLEFIEGAMRDHTIIELLQCGTAAIQEEELRFLSWAITLSFVSF